MYSETRDKEIKKMTTLFKMMIDRYNAVAYTHNYIWGFTYKKVVYMATTTA